MKKIFTAFLLAVLVYWMTDGFPKVLLLFQKCFSVRLVFQSTLTP